MMELAAGAVQFPVVIIILLVIVIIIIIIPLPVTGWLTSRHAAGGQPPLPQATDSLPPQ